MSKAFKRISYINFGRIFESRISEGKMDDFDRILKQSGYEGSIRLYLGMMVFGYILTAIGIFILSLVSILILIPDSEMALFLVILAVPGSLIISLIVPLYGYYYPRYKISERQRRIDSALPTVASYMSAMASSGVPPAEIFASMEEEEISPDFNIEVSRINRDIHILGLDILQAMRQAAKRAPSEKLAGFFEGISATITSGGDLQFYLATETKTLMKMKEEESKAIIEQLGVLSEIFMVLGVVAPLFFIIMVAIMSVLGLGGSSEMSLAILVGLIYVLVPVMMMVMLILVSTLETTD
ncbi:MAG: type II secretion system F family protein [Candidatus Hodarchaeales archaeon]